MASSPFPPLASSSSSNELDADNKKPHVLAVDDSFLDRKLVERLLTKSACKVTTAESGREALELLGLADGHHTKNKVNVDLIVTDYSMPEMTGYELLKKVKESPTTKDIVVIILSSEKDPRLIEQCLEEGANAFMTKPLQQEDVGKLKCRMKEFSNPDESGTCVSPRVPAMGDEYGGMPSNSESGNESR